MGCLLTIGGVPAFVHPALAEYWREFAAPGEAMPQAWLDESIQFEAIDPLNLGSITFFTRHAARLDGIVEDRDEAMDRCRWRQLPWWMESYWLPVEGCGTKRVCGAPPRRSIWERLGFERQRLILVDGPKFVGSARGLLRDLAEIRELSPHGLGEKPAQYDSVNGPGPAAGADSDFRLDGRATLQWVWYALWDGATKSIERNMPLSGI